MIQLKNKQMIIAVKKHELLNLQKYLQKNLMKALVHQVTTDFMANQRSGTKAQKNRSAVSGGGAKPRPQKGSGRARAGTTRSPIWRTGGVTFAAQPKDYNKKINKKMYKGALNCIFNELLKRERLFLSDSLNFAEKKTKLGKELLDRLKITNALFISTENNANVFFSLRNIKNISVIDYKDINPHILMKHDNIVIDKNVLEHIRKGNYSMNTQRLANIIVSPRISEKATMRADLENQHVFSVLKDATKPEVKKAVELMFDVKVKSVRLMNVQGKLTRIGRTFGKRKDWKKAYVRLQEGFDINYGEEEVTK
jgi:large subunit ribosomal protein L4